MSRTVREDIVRKAPWRPTHAAYGFHRVRDSPPALPDEWLYTIPGLVVGSPREPCVASWELPEPLGSAANLVARVPRATANARLLSLGPETLEASMAISPEVRQELDRAVGLLGEKKSSFIADV
jgi:hypothetical protein